MTPHPTNTRALTAEVAAKYAKQELAVRPRAGVHALHRQPAARLPRERLPGPAGSVLLRRRRRRDLRPADGRGPHVGVPRRRARRSRASTPRSCPASGSSRSARSAPLDVADQLWVARWLLYRVGEDFGINATLDPKPAQGRLERRRRATRTSRRRRCARATTRSSPPARRSARSRSSTCKVYGYGIEGRLTGLHETAPWNEFSYGVSNRGASVRIPWQVEVDKKGYIEDRRPNANCDPYLVTKVIVETCCGALEKKGLV